jgi:hypothetical protein
MLNNEIFTEGMVRLSTFFKKEDMSKLYLQDYYKTIQGLTSAQFSRAVDYLQRNHKSGFFPVPAEFHQAVHDSREQIEVTPEAKRIETIYVPCPPAVKEMMKNTMEKWKRRSMK